MKRALVTGSAGFVGSAFVERLVADSWDVDMVDIRNPFPHNTDVRRFFAESERRYDLAVHCAAVVGGRATIDGDPLAVADNLSIDTAAVRWAVRTRPHHFVYFSSSAAYPIYLQRRRPKDSSPHINERRLEETDINPDLPEQPDQTYGWAKLTGERLVRLAETEGVRCHTFRPFSGYGPSQSTDYPFGAFLARAARRARPFTIWGDGDAIRDWVHIDDILGAVLAAVEADLTGPYNICTGVGTNFNTLARQIARAAGYDPLYEHKLDAPQGVTHRVGNPTRLNTFYTPAVSLEDGVARAVTRLLTDA